MASMHPRPPEETEVETIQPPQGRREPRQEKLRSLFEADWLEGPQGQMSLAEVLTAAAFGVDREQASLPPVDPPAKSGINSPP
eukprot:9885349-Karenia_brevis.AAC.1